MTQTVEGAPARSPDELLLEVWERGRLLAPADRALMLARLAPATSAESRDLDCASVGGLQRRLFELRRTLFGSGIVGLAECETCGSTLELTISVEDVLREEHAPPDQVFEERIGNYDVVFRLPTAADLRDAGELTDAEEARRLLIGRCVARASRDGAEAVPERLPKRVYDDLGRRIVNLDPLIDVVLVAPCRECGADSTIPLDVGRYVWSEIENWALHLLDEVHLLASSYGWSERDILGLPPDRRQIYVELAAC